MSEPKFSNPKKNQEQTPRSAGQFLDRFLGFMSKLIDLKAGLDKEGSIVNIKNNKKMEGANAWLLMCSIMIASLGLDLNSPAVIIGAMLISPLMSPILGIGLAIGINDRNTFWISLRHFGMSIAIAIVTSTLYFSLTPFEGNETDEIIARTAPTLLDVLVAFFGGIAGIISGSRKDKSNAIPGVAIATALMPPLCVTGYGLANGNWEFMFNSFYLFFLNATFVAGATYLIVRLLDFPYTTIVNPEEGRRTRWILGAFGLLMILPSGLTLYSLLNRASQERVVIQFVKENFEDAIYRIERIDHTDSIDIKLLTGKYYKPDSVAYFQDLLAARGAKKFNLRFLQDAESREAIEDLRSSQQNYVKVVEDSKRIQVNQEQKIKQLYAQMDSLNSDTLLFRKLSREIKVLFPELESFSLSNSSNLADLNNDNRTNMPMLFVDWNDELDKARRKKDKETNEARLIEFIKLRAGLDTIKVTR
ncbi:MAG: DUF389 domain-containing protein [Bacteroidota bacterium]